MTTHLWDGTEVEDALVAEAGHVGEDVRNVMEGVGDEFVETGDCLAPPLRAGQLQHLLAVLAPCLQHNAH